MYNKPYRLLLQEGALAKAALMAGLEHVAKSNFDMKGSYYLGLFQLSIGLERLMKIVIVLNFKIENNLANPTDKQLRKYGHKLVDTYQVCRQIALVRSPGQEDWYAADTLEHEALIILSTFADGARYYNLDQLGGLEKHDDPLLEWMTVQQRIADHYVSYKRKERVHERVIAHCDRYKLYGFEQHPNGEFRTQIDMSYIHEMLRLARGYSVWTIIRLLHPFYALLTALSKQAQELEGAPGLGQETIPYMYEFFPFCLCDRQTSTTRKKWIDIY